MMSLNIFVKFGLWLVRIFGGKHKLVDQAKSTIFQGCKIDRLSLHNYKEASKEALEEIIKKYSLPDENFASFSKAIDSSSTPEAFIFTTGLITGATASASGSPSINEEGLFWDEVKKKVWTCRHCGNINTTPISKPCPGCGRKNPEIEDIQPDEPRG